MTSRPATVMVIFTVACIAFCLATVFASMTGPISILPNESSGGVLDNLSAIDNYSYGQDDTQDYDSYYEYDDYSDDSYSEPEVETTTETTTTTQQTESTDVETTVEDSGSSNPNTDDSHVENTVDNG